MSTQVLFPRQENEVYIYGLFCPKTGFIRYVGKTNNLERREYEHFKGKDTKVDSHKRSWIEILKLNGLKPKMKVLEVVHKDLWQQKEKQFISMFKALGYPLVNLTTGGCGDERTEQEKLRISKSMKGVPKTKDHVDKVTKGLKEWWKQDSEVREKQINKLRYYNSKEYRSQFPVGHFSKKRLLTNEEIINIAEIQNKTGDSTKQLSIKFGLKVATLNKYINLYKKGKL